MTVRLRPHHLLCLLTYVGEGYSPAFVVNCDRVAARLSAGEGVLVVDGPDDVCAPIAGEEGAHCGRASVVERDRRAAADVAATLGCPIGPGAALRLDAMALRRLRAAFASSEAQATCAGCEWAGLCGDVAARGFGGARVGRA